jgi:ribosomal protein S27E
MPVKRISARAKSQSVFWLGTQTAENIAGWKAAVTTRYYRLGHTLMDADHSRVQERKVEQRVALLRAVEAGTFVELPCPDCGHHTVSAWFTHPAADEYRTWFVCADCPFEMRAHDTGRPSRFCEERVHDQFQERDRAVLAARRL